MPCRRSIMSAQGDAAMAFRADHQPFPLSGNHDPRPFRFRRPARSVDVGELADVVGLKRPLLPAGLDLTFPGKESVDGLGAAVAWGVPPCVEVESGCGESLWNPPEGEAAEGGRERWLVGA